MKKTITAVLVFLSVNGFLATSQSDLDNHWNVFQKIFKKKYTLVQEEHQRRLIWERNAAYIAKHNREYDLGLHSFNLGLNEFADKNTEEITMRPKKMAITTPQSIKTARKVPDSIDWRKKGCAGRVHNQGQMGQSYVFTTVESIEGQLCSRQGENVSLSTQNVADCCKPIYGYQFECIKKMGGIDTYNGYPSHCTKTCCYNPATRGAVVNGEVNITNGDESDLQEAVAGGPVAVVIDASHTSFQLYRGGVYDEPKCSSQQLDHAVMVVSYGKQDGKDYWLVKNSWGTSWGMDGYILMSRNKNNQCGIATFASYPLVA